MSESIAESGLFSEALERFRALWEEARAAEPWEANAMSLATADTGGRVSVRTVLLKEVSSAGFAFYTNYDSRKGRDLAANPRAALCFFWRDLRRQVVVEGRVGRLDSAESDAYFATRSRRAQLGAWASTQSRPLVSRTDLDARFQMLEREYAGREVPRPPYWGGYRLAPDLIEFWAPGEGRLNERERYTRGADGAWSFGLFNP
ncbi:MAG: pyridoxamine 5'-phosphate oxidase [Gammaproteobacteria bacterium]